jgi:Bifunctional DNA primase/polymerase, N-terminal/AAA domain
MKDTITTLEAASRYVASGYRVLPIKPGEKRPPMREWTKAATTDPATVADWWAPGGVYEHHGIGLALGWQDTPYGQRCVFAIDLDEHDPEHSGAKAWGNLLAEHGDTDETVAAATGGGGMHFLFACETHVRNGKIAPGVDVRGDGGQIVVAPTLHPSGQPYEWIEGRAPWEHDLADAPDWLIELVTEAERPEPKRVAIPVGGQSGAIAVEKGPADILREHWNWQDRLGAAGWTYSHAQGVDEHWTRPGKAVREGVSAVLHTDTGVLVVFSTDASVHSLRAVGSLNPDGSVSLTPFHFFAATAHGGDTSAAASAIRRKHNAEQQATSQLGNQAVTGPRIIDPDDDEEEVEPQVDDLGLIDWNEAFGNHAPEVPIIDGLIYPGRWTAIVAPAKAGKSTWTLHIAHRLARGIDPWDASKLLPDGPVAVLYLDAEMGRLDTVGRLAAIGLTASDLDNLAYTDLPHKFDQIEKASWLHRACNLIQPTVVILDGINGFVTGAEKDDTPWRSLYEFAIAPLKQAGIAVISTDNTGKDEQLGARGSTVKNDKADAIFTMRAGRDEYMNHTTTITRKHARTTAFLDSLMLRVNGIGTGKVEYVLPGAAPTAPMIVTRDDILRVCRTLTGLGLPDNASLTEAMKELRMEGYSIRSSLIQAAVEYRREGNPVDMEGDHLTQTPASQLVNEVEDDPEPEPNNLF